MQQQLSIAVGEEEEWEPSQKVTRICKKGVMKLLSFPLAAFEFFSFLLTGLVVFGSANPRTNILDGIFSSDAPHIQVYSFNDINAVTNNFSNENKLGEGGYGPVYKVLNCQVMCGFSSS